MDPESGPVTGPEAKPVVTTVASERTSADRIAALGEMMGTIIAGIYEGIRTGAMDRPSDFETAAGRSHQSWERFFSALRV